MLVRAALNVWSALLEKRSNCSPYEWWVYPFDVWYRESGRKGNLSLAENV